MWVKRPLFQNRLQSGVGHSHHVIITVISCTNVTILIFLLIVIMHSPYLRKQVRTVTRREIDVECEEDLNS